MAPSQKNFEILFWKNADRI